MEYVIGIDLGTTNSEVAVIKNEKLEIIPVEGEKVMPSCVGINEKGDLLVGRPARNQMIVNPESTVLSVKRKMGQAISISLGDKEFSPEEVSSLILKKLKTCAEEYLKAEVTKAVITVPAYFDDSQRKATKNAGILAGLDVLRIVNEPTAAALAYDSDQQENQNILVYDLGGGTFDVSLVVVENGVVEVKSSHGDTNLGGDDFDDLLIDHVTTDFNEKYGVDLLNDPRARNRIWSAVEIAKRELSDAPFARILEEYIHGDLHLDLEISRMDYEEMIRPLLRKTIDCVHKCLKDAAFLPGAVDKIILVGGSTRTPLVAEMLRQDMNIESRHEINPDLIVSMGAAIQGGIFNGVKSHSVLVDITPYTFGTTAVDVYKGEMRSDVFVPIIKRNVALPVSKGEVFTTMSDNQDSVDVRIYQGENDLSVDNIFIGNFLIEDLSEVPAGNEIILNLKLDMNGILDVTAVEKMTGKSKSVRMDTSGCDYNLDIDKARNNLSSLMNKVPEFQRVSSEVENIKEDTISRAKALRKRAEKLIDTLDETDAKEISDLIHSSKDAVRDNNLEELEQMNESLSDMLFYLED